MKAKRAAAGTAVIALVTAALLIDPRSGLVLLLVVGGLVLLRRWR